MYTSHGEGVINPTVLVEYQTSLEIPQIDGSSDYLNRRKDFYQRDTCAKLRQRSRRL